MSPQNFLLACLLAVSAGLSAANPTPTIRGRFDLFDAKSGQRVTQASYAGKPRLVFFGFTHCPLTCPLGLNTLDKVLARLGKDAAKVEVLFITVDPKRDTAERLRLYMEAHDERMRPLTGSPRAVAAAMRDFRLEAERMGKGEDYVFEHPAIIYLMGKEGEYLKSLPSNGDAKELANEVRARL